MNNKLRSDCVFAQLTPEQVETLEGWLFEENLGYKEALGRVEKEFGVKGSLTGLRRFYRRLAMERSREELMEMVSVCAEALATAKTDGSLQAGLITLATKVATEFLVQSPEKVREFTALLRAITSAQALEMKRVEFQRAEDKLQKEEFEKEQEEKRRLELLRKNRERREAREKLREEAAAGGVESSKDQGPSSKETTNSKLQIVEEKVETAGSSAETLRVEVATRDDAREVSEAAAKSGEGQGAPPQSSEAGTPNREPGCYRIIR